MQMEYYSVGRFTFPESYCVHTYVHTRSTPFARTPGSSAASCVTANRRPCVMAGSQQQLRLELVLR